MFGIGGDKKVLSLDWDTQSLRIVQWQLGRNSAKVRRLVSSEVPRDVEIKDAASMGSFIKDVLAQERIGTSSVILDIPRDQAVLNTMSLPSVDLNDLASMVQLQIAKELPFPLSGAIVDFAVSEHSSGASTSDVLVAAIRHEVLEFYTEVCTHAGLKLERVGLRPYANMVAVLEMLGDHSPERVLIVDVGPTMTEIDVLRDDVLVFSRAASAHLDDLVEALQVPDSDADAPAGPPVAGSKDDVMAGLIKHLSVEITRSAEAYRSTDPGARFDQLVVAGNCGFEDQLAALLSERFMVKARIYDPGPLLTERQRSGVKPCSFAAAIGLGLGHAAEGKLHFDFLHPKKAMDARTRRLRQLPLVGAAAAAVLLIGVAAYAIDVYPKKRAITELNADIEQLEKKAKRYEVWEEKLDLLDTWEQQQVMWPEELALFAEALPDPEQAFLDNLVLGKGKITFKIMARQEQTIRDFLSDLEDQVRQADPKAAANSVFVPPDKVAIKNAKGTDYPFYSSMTVKLKRIEDLDSDQKKKKSKRRKRN